MERDKRAFARHSVVFDAEVVRLLLKATNLESREITLLKSIVGFLSFVLLINTVSAQPGATDDPAGRVPSKALYLMSNAEIDTLIRRVSAAESELVRRIAIYSETAKGTPYALFCLGEGPNAKYDRDPLIDFTRADCVTFTEQILAMAISDNYDNMFNNLQRIRYHRGNIDLRTRNHFTHADWVPNNAWLLQDVTAAVGGKHCREMTKTIDRRKLLSDLDVPESEQAEIRPAETMTIKYIPEHSLLAVQDSLQTGDLFSIIQSMPGIFSAHMGLIIRKEDGEVYCRHASSRRETKQVVDEPLSAMVAQLQANRKRVGMAFLRVKPDFNLAAQPVPPQTGHEIEQ